MIALLMWGGWSSAEEHTIVIIFGFTLGGFIAAMAAVMVGLLVGGPVGRFKGSAGRDGISLEAECDSNDHAGPSAHDQAGRSALPARWPSRSWSTTATAGKRPAALRLDQVVAEQAAHLRDRRHLSGRRRSRPQGRRRTCGASCRSEQVQINERTADDFESRIAAARARAASLMLQRAGRSSRRSRSRRWPSSANARPIRCPRRRCSSRRRRPTSSRRRD